MVGEALQFLPVVTTVAGYATGQLMEQKALNDIARNRAALMEAHQVEAHQASDEVVSESDRRQELLRRGFVRGFTGLALLGGVTGYFAGEAMKPSDNQEAMRPELAVTVDHNFAVDHGNAFKKGNSIAERMSEGKLNVIARVAHNGTHQKILIEELDNDTPYGPPSMADAMPAAMDDVYNTYEKKPAVADSKEKFHAAVLMVTSGSRIGNQDAVVKRAKSQGELPVFIANTDGRNDEVNRELKDIAERTGGNYWGPKADVDEIAENIEKRAKARPAQGEAEQNDDRVKNGLLALILAGVTARLYSRRKSETAVS